MNIVDGVLNAGRRGLAKRSGDQARKSADEITAAVNTLNNLEKLIHATTVGEVTKLHPHHTILVTKWMAGIGSVRMAVDENGPYAAQIIDK